MSLTITGTIGRTMLSSAATIFVDVAASQMVGLTTAAFIAGFDAASAASFSFDDGALGRNGSELAESLDGEAYLRSCSNVACLRLQILHEIFALFVHALA